MSKARGLANIVAEGSALADGVVALSEISGGTNDGILYTTSEGVTHSGSNLTFDGDHLHVSGNVNATTFIGDGSELTGIDALPSQTDNDNKYLKTNGTVATWEELVIPEVPVDSVNGYTGVVSLSASDVGAATTSDILTAVAGLASETYVNTAVSNLVDSSPATLDTLNELAAALGDDPNFATTVSTNIGTKADKTTLISAGTGLTGGGDFSANRTISHSDTSNQNSVNNSGGTVIQDVTLDTFGHITGLASVNLDGRYAPVSHEHSIDAITDEHRLFNNMGANHTTTTDFNSVPNFGAKFVQGGTNGPTSTGTHQFYGFTLGIGNDYSISEYASQLYWARQAQAGGTYLWARDLENGAWGSWRKMSAGYADSAGFASTADYATTAGAATYNQVLDTRAGQYSPNAYEDYRSTYEFTNQITGLSDWHSSMTIQGWHGGYSAWQIIGPASTSAHENWYLRSGINLSWNPARLIVHTGNVSSYAPTLTGGGASGTWPISITGNAAYATTAGSADQIDGWGFVNTGNNNPVNADTINSNGISYYTLGVPNFSGNASDGALYSQIYSAHWQHQIAGDYRSGQIALRGKNSGTWQAWRTVLDSSNVSSYAALPGHTHAYLPLSGGNMSGNIGRTSHSSGYLVGGHNNIGDTSIKTNPIYAIGSGYQPNDNDLVDMYGIGYSHPNAAYDGINTVLDGWGLYVAANGTARVGLDGNNGRVKATGGMYAPIYYDSDNTGYYVDPAGSSVSASLNGPIVMSSTAWTGEVPGKLQYHSNNWYLQAADTILFRNSVGTNTFYSDFSGNTTSNTSSRAPIFYDSNDTTYYVDPASTTTSVQVAGAIEQGHNYAHPNIEWAASGNSTGEIIFYLPGNINNYGMVHMVFDIYEYASPRTATVIIGGHNWTSGWYNTACNVVGYTDKTVRLGVKDSRFCVIFGGTTSGWSYGQIRLRKIQNGSYYNNIMNLGGDWAVTQTTSESFTSITGDLRNLYTPANLEVGNISYAYGSSRAPVFYDSNDTGYYVDPNGTTNIGAWTSNSSINVQTGTGSSVYQQITNTNGSGVYAYLQLSASGAGNGYLIKNRTTGNNVSNQSLYLWNDPGPIEFIPNGNVALRTTLSTGGILTVATDVRAPIFYDSNDTAYHVDPNSWSQLSHGNFNTSPSGRTLSLGGDQTDRVYNDSARSSLVINATHYPHLYINATASNGNGHHGAVFSMSGTLSAGGYRRWGMGISNTDPDCFSWGYADNNSNPHYGVGGVFGYTGTNAKMWLNTGGSLMTTGDMRAPIFYDSNNTNYYIDPVSGSNTYGIQINNGGHGDSRWCQRYTHSEASGNAQMLIWCSEPGLSYDGAGIGSNINVSGQYYGRDTTGNPYGVYLRFDVNHGYAEFYTTTSTPGPAGGQGGRRWYVDSSGNSVASGNVTAYSDIRLKTNIQVITGAIDKVSKIRGVTYERTDTETPLTQVGVIAQEVELVLPEAVSEDENGIKQVAYGNMVGLLIEAIKEQQITIESQETRIAKLEALVESLINK